MRFIFFHSHAFPGARVIVEDDGESDSQCLAEFGDGATVIVDWRLVQRKDGIWRSQRA